MNGDQVIQTRNLIIECYPYFTPEDFVRCFKNIKTLKYGKLYEGFDGSKLLDAMAQYDIERDNEIMEYRKYESEKWKQETPLMSDQVLEILKKHAKEPEPKIKVVREESESGKLTKKYMKEFDDLFTKQTDKIIYREPIRFVDYKEKKMSRDQYMNARWDEDFPANNEPNEKNTK